MHSKLKAYVFSFLVLVSVYACRSARESEVDRIFASYKSPYPGAAVEVIHKGDIALSMGYGLANVEENIPVTDSTDFRLASVTKQFTAMCVLQLIDKGELSFETNLKELFPTFPEYGRKITIKNLLQHTSGLIDYEHLISDTATVQVKDRDVLKMMESTDSTYFEPGTKHQYSNTGYAVLTQVIEKITNIPFRTYLKENIFNPLGMKNTLAYEKGINIVPNRAYGYTIEPNGISRTDQSITSAVLGDGGIYSNLKDLYLWDQALYDTVLVSKHLRDQAFLKGKTKDGKTFNYGYGWRIENYKGNYVVYHTGSTEGFRNIIYRIPAKNFTVVILTNRNAKGDFGTLKFARAITDLYLN